MLRLEGERGVSLIWYQTICHVLWPLSTPSCLYWFIMHHESLLSDYWNSPDYAHILLAYTTHKHFSFKIMRNRKPLFQGKPWILSMVTDFTYFTLHVALQLFRTPLPSTPRLRTAYQKQVPIPSKWQLTVSMLCHKPASFLKSRTFTMVSPETRNRKGSENHSQVPTSWSTERQGLWLFQVCCKLGCSSRTVISKPWKTKRSPSLHILPI